MSKSVKKIKYMITKIILLTILIGLLCVLVFQYKQQECLIDYNGPIENTQTFHSKITNKYDVDMSYILQEPPYSFADFQNNLDTEEEKEQVHMDMRYFNNASSLKIGHKIFENSTLTTN